MSVVIIGGHDRMVRQYKEICRNHKYKAKVFTQMCTGLDKQIGSPDLLILFTSTVSHKMIRCVLEEVDEQRTDVVRCHTTRVCHFIQYIIIKFFLILQGFPCFFNTHMI